MHVQLSFQEFAKEQGCPYIVSNPTAMRGPTNRVLFANGAVSDGVWNHCPPPTDKRGCLLARRDYLRARLEREEKEFIEFRAECVQQIHLAARFSNLPPPPADAADQLRAGAARIQQLQTELAQVEADLVDPEEQKRRQHAEEQQRRKAAEMDDFRATIQSIHF